MSKALTKQTTTFPDRKVYIMVKYAMYITSTTKN